jgi:hypothetical protein
MHILLDLLAPLDFNRESVLQVGTEITNIYYLFNYCRIYSRMLDWALNYNDFKICVETRNLGHASLL